MHRTLILIPSLRSFQGLLSVNRLKRFTDSQALLAEVRQMRHDPRHHRAPQRAPILIYRSTEVKICRLGRTQERGEDAPDHGLAQVRT